MLHKYEPFLLNTPIPLPDSPWTSVYTYYFWMVPRCTWLGRRMCCTSTSHSCWTHPSPSCCTSSPPSYSHPPPQATTPAKISPYLISESVFVFWESLAEKSWFSFKPSQRKTNVFSKWDKRSLRKFLYKSQLFNFRFAVYEIWTKREINVEKNEKAIIFVF
jgi:hypothetical protein